MEEMVLEIKGLEVKYITDDFTVHAVNGIDLNMKKGATVGLVGETGAGKTTTALAIMGLLPDRTGKVTGGEILFEGTDLLRLTDKEMNKCRGNQIAMIYQDPMTSLNPTITVEKQIAEVLRVHHVCDRKEITQKTVELLALVGIHENRAGDYPHQFSGGMKQRIVIAMALAAGPALLIADEPTTALDVTIQAQVLEMVKELKENVKTSMLLITHDLGIVGEICDEMAVMYAGQIVEWGPVEDIFLQPKHPYTQGLLKAAPDMGQKVKRLNAITGMMPDPAALPPGCKFHPRCSHASDRCATEEPNAMKCGERTVRCFL